MKLVLLKIALIWITLSITGCVLWYFSLRLTRPRCRFCGRRLQQGYSGRWYDAHDEDCAPGHSHHP